MMWQCTLYCLLQVTVAPSSVMVIAALVQSDTIELWFFVQQVQTIQQSNGHHLEAGGNWIGGYHFMSCVTMSVQLSGSSALQHWLLLQCFGVASRWFFAQQLPLLPQWVATLAIYLDSLLLFICPLWNQSFIFEWTCYHGTTQSQMDNAAVDSKMPTASSQLLSSINVTSRLWKVTLPHHVDMASKK